jgi:eukaryotic-like serine/threonine-protein kinase
VSKEETIFTEALGKGLASERDAYLDQACAGNAALRSDVDALLLAHQKGGGILEAPLAGLDTLEETTPNAVVGTTIGSYKLLEKIGEGGMGVVYMAEQVRPIRRKVALKIIKAGMDTRRVIARFEAERQALALMDHENIAKVFDAGTTDAGRLYFVMELVKGVPITKYCDEHHLSPRDRLELFVPVCRAVQHAHNKGIIHRDLKPSNVLVAHCDGKPVPKVIDFGVAKATSGQPLTERTMFTGFGDVIGTLEYMSPEQAEVNQLDVDTRSDVYSLGVVLYELLTGSTPLEHKRVVKTALLEMLRVIREEEPPAPSTRLSTSEALPSIAANRGLEAKKLSGMVHGELDWIVMKSLEKDRNRRYETANGFAMDVQRYLDDEAVHACPPSARYRFSKFARRNKHLLAVVALFTAGLLIVVSAVAASIGWATRDRAARQAVLEQQIASALQESEQHYAHSELPEATLAVRHAEDLLAGASVTPLLQQRVRRWRADVEMVKRLDDIRLDKIRGISGSYWREADAAYTQAFSTYAIDIGSLSVQEAAKRIGASSIAQRLIWALDDWRLAKIPAGNLAGGEILLKVADLADTDAVRRRVRQAAARGVPEELRKLAEDDELFDQQPPETACLLVLPLRRSGQLPLALEVLRRLQRRHPDDFWLNYDTGWMLMITGQPGPAAEFLRAAMAVSPRNASVHLMIGYAFVAKGDSKEGEAEYREALRLDPNHARALWSLYQMLRIQKRLDETQEAYEQLLRVDPNNHAMCSDLAWCLLADADAQHDPSCPLRLSRKAVKLAPNYRSGWAVLGVAEYRAGNWQAAAAALETSAELGAGGDARDWLFLAMCHWQLGDKRAARKWRDQALVWMDQNRNLPITAELQRFRAEAEQLLKMDDEKPTTKSESK